MSPKQPDKRSGITTFDQSLIAEGSNLDRQSSWNWLLLVLVSVLTTFGLVVSLLTLLDARGDSPWPWPKSEVFLGGTLIVVSLLFIGYITFQQRRLARLRRAQFHQRLMANLDVTRSLSETDPQAVFNHITETCLRTYNCDQVSFMLLDDEEATLEVCSAMGHPNANKLLGARQKVGHGIAGWVAEKLQPVILGPDLDRGYFREVQPKVYSTSSAMVVPVILGDELLGILSVSSRNGKTRYNKEDLRSLMILAENAAICCRQVKERTLLRSIIQDHEVIGANHPIYPPRRIA